MIRQLLEEVKAAPLDEASRSRLKEIHRSSIKELEAGLAPELVEELERLSLPFTEEGTPSEGRAADRAGPAGRLARGPVPRHPDRDLRPADGRPARSSSRCARRCRRASTPPARPGEHQAPSGRASPADVPLTAGPTRPRAGPQEAGTHAAHDDEPEQARRASGRCRRAAVRVSVGRRVGDPVNSPAPAAPGPAGPASPSRQTPDVATRRRWPGGAAAGVAREVGPVVLDEEDVLASGDPGRDAAGLAGPRRDDLHGLALMLPL